MNMGDINTFSEDFKNTMSGFQARLDEVLQSQTLSVNNSESRKVPLDILIQDFKDFQCNVLSYINNLKGVVEDNAKRIDNLENYSRRNCLIFHGIPERKDETYEELENEVLDTINSLKVPNYSANAEMIDRCHRLGRQKKDNLLGRAMIVKFVSYKYRNIIWSNKKELKGTKKLITESLSNTRLDVYKEARDAFGDKSVWTKDSRIVVKIGKNYYTILFQDELQKLKLQHPNVLGKKSSVRTRSQNKRGG